MFFLSKEIGTKYFSCKFYDVEKMLFLLTCNVGKTLETFKGSCSNQSINAGIFSVDTKTAVITRVYKSGSKTERNENTPL